MITGKLSSGYEFNVDETVLDSWKCVKAIGLCESKNKGESLYGLTQLISILLGNEEEKLIKYIEEKNNGKCTQTDMQNAVKEILEKIKTEKEIKNSESSPE